MADQPNQCNKRPPTLIPLCNPPQDAGHVVDRPYQQVVDEVGSGRQGLRSTGDEGRRAKDAVNDRHCPECLAGPLPGVPAGGGVRVEAQEGRESSVRPPSQDGFAAEALVRA